MNGRLTLAAISLLATCATTVAAKPAVSPAPGAAPLSQPTPLDPQTIQTIQSLGRAVLHAKHDAAPDPDDEALFVGLKGLASDLAKPAYATETPSTITLEKNNGTGNTERHASPLAKGQMLRNHLSALRDLRQQIAARGQKHEHRNQVHAQRTAALAAKVADLEQAVAAALEAPEAERRKKLRVLMKRLRVENRQEYLDKLRQAASKTSVEEPTPTLSTIVRHR